MIPRALLAATAGALLWLALSWGLSAYARSCRVGLLPNGSRNGCGNCHTSSRGGGPRNAFGTDAGKLTGGTCNAFWGASLAALDSDGDGQTNGVELGDPEGLWKPGQPQPGDPTKVLNPGVRDAPVPFLRGDVDLSGGLTIADAIALLRVLVASRPHSSCRATEDANGDGRIDLGDAVHLLAFLFQQGAAPAAPFPACAPLPGTVPCAAYGRCPGA